MRIVFAGTPEFAATALEALHGAGHDIALVLTQPDRPSGRGLKPLPSAVKRLAQGLKIPLEQPSTLKDPRLTAALGESAPEAIVVAAYGLLVPPALLRLPPRGCLNIHASLLPRWRGAAPIQRALLAGDRETGISIMQMDEGLDTGPVLLQQAIAIDAQDTAGTLHDRLAALGAHLILRALDGAFTPAPQDPSEATYAAKIEKHEALIDWTRSADVVDRQIRAFNPVPGATTRLRGAPLKIWRAARGPAVAGAPGTVCDLERGVITVACGEGSSVKLLELQRSGGKRLGATAFLSGAALERGERLGE
jgi:methionyl-tRNA formyltransferase